MNASRGLLVQVTGRSAHPALGEALRQLAWLARGAGAPVWLITVVWVMPVVVPAWYDQLVAVLAGAGA